MGSTEVRVLVKLALHVSRYEEHQQQHERVEVVWDKFVRPAWKNKDKLEQCRYLWDDDEASLREQRGFDT